VRRRSTCRSKTDCNIDQDEDILEHCKALDTWFGYEQHETHITLELVSSNPDMMPSRF
jgi:hypothetical protein